MLIKTGVLKDIQNIQQEARINGMNEELFKRYNKEHKETTEKRIIIEKN